MRSRILVIARSVELRGRLARLLKAAGHAVELAESAAHARRIDLNGFALAVVAPDGLGSDAKSLIAELEAQAIKAIPLGLELGSLDPGDETALLARITEAVRPVTVAEELEPVLRFDRFRLDLAGHSLTNEAGNEIPLTRGEFNLLREFAQRPGRVLSRDQLLQALAGRDAESYDRSIDMSLVRLRRKIEPDPKRPSLIVTVTGSGYKFTAKVTKETATPVEAEVEPLPAAPQPSPPTRPERRQLTIMQCALAGPAFIAARRDPEDLQRLLAAFREHCRAVIADAGGTIDRLLNNGVLAYFGYPQADEHQAERAVGSALKLVETAEKIDTAQLGQLQVRIGIATGLAVVGGQSNVSSEPAALGEAADLAAGLVSRAGPNTVLISASTRRLVGELFEFRECEPIALQGAGEPAEAWQVTAEAVAESRFEALHGATLAPLIGREEELELLLRRWDQAKAGNGKLILISGEPGIGKSRLTRAFQDSIVEQSHIELRFFCSPHHQDSALYPHIAQLERVARFARDDTDEAKLSKLDAVLAQSDATDEAVALIAELLSIPTDQSERIQQMTPQLRRDKTLAALLDQLVSLAKRQPVLTIYEDVHWIDPSSRELLDHVVEQVEPLPVLLLATFRPEFQPPWIGQANSTNLALTRLDRRDTAAMIAEVAGDDRLPAEIVQEITDRTDGVPLFIEEVTKAALESGAQAGETLASMPHPKLAVPATLQASLIARLDRLGPVAKDIAQKGAAVGREFKYELIAAISNRPEPELRKALDVLTSAGLLFARGVPPESTYLFKHALVQDTAYGTLVRARRHQVHARIATTLETQFSEIAERQPELLAHHLTAADKAERAIGYWFRAGERAMHRSASREAVAHLRAALGQIEQLPHSIERTDWELRVMIALGPALMMTTSSAPPEVATVYARARRLAKPTGRSVELFQALWGSWLTSCSAGDLHRAGALVEELFTLARQQASDELVFQARHAEWATAISQGDLLLAWRSLEAGVPLYRRDAYAHHALLYGGHDPGVCGRGLAGMVAALLGHFDRALIEASEALALGRSLSHHGSLAHAYWTACEVYYLRRDSAALCDIAREALPYC